MSAGPLAVGRGALAPGGLGMATGGFGEWVPVSISRPELSSLPQGSGATTRRTPNAVSGATCRVGGARAARGSAPTQAGGTLGSISEAAAGSMAQ